MKFDREKAAFLHCRNCHQRHQRDRLEVAVNAHGLLIGCMTCGSSVAIFTPEALLKMCGEMAAKGAGCLCDVCRQKARQS